MKNCWSSQKLQTSEVVIVKMGIWYSVNRAFCYAARARIPWRNVNNASIRYKNCFVPMQSGIVQHGPKYVP